MTLLPPARRARFLAGTLAEARLLPTKAAHAGGAGIRNQMVLCAEGLLGPGCVEQYLSTSLLAGPPLCQSLHLLDSINNTGFKLGLQFHFNR